MPRLSRMRLLAPIPSFGIEMRLLVIRELVGGLCIFAVRLRRSLLLASRLARCVLHRLDADVVALVGTANPRGEAAGDVRGNLELGRVLQNADGADVILLDAAAAA